MGISPHELSWIIAKRWILAVTANIHIIDTGELSRDPHFLLIVSSKEDAHLLRAWGKVPLLSEGRVE